MAVATVNLILEKGTDFYATFNIRLSDATTLYLNEFTGVAKIRKYPTSPISHTFDLEIDPATSAVTISMSKEDTMDLESGRNYFDVFLTETATQITSKAVEGSIIVYDSISS